MILFNARQIAFFNFSSSTLIEWAQYCVPCSILLKHRQTFLLLPFFVHVILRYGLPHSPQTSNVVYANGHTKSKFELKQPYQCKAKSREKIILAAFTFDKVFCRFTIALIAISVCRLQCKGKVYKIRYRCVATRRLLYG